jgi:hypothetical protein
MARRRLRRMAGIIATGAVAVAASVLATIALATPGSGTDASVLSKGTLAADVVFKTGHVQGGGMSWFGRHWSSDQLPEFLAALRQNGTANLGEWLALHPAGAAKLGLTPLGLLKSPEVVKQRITYPAEAHTGWHSLAGGYLTATVVSGEVVRYNADCTSQKFTAGQSFYQPGANTFIVKNESSREAVLTATYVAPNGTPETGLHLDKQQPTGCNK